MEDNYRIAKFDALIHKIHYTQGCGGSTQDVADYLYLIYDILSNMNEYANFIYIYFGSPSIQHENKIKSTTRLVTNRRSHAIWVLFWALMVLAVDDTDKEKHLSLICDFARMLEVTDDEMKDLVNVIKRIFKCGDYEPVKTQRVRDIFYRDFWDKF